PFLLTRINAAIARDTSGFWTKAGALISRPQNAFAGLLFILLLNVLVIIQINKQAPDTTVTKDEFVVNVSTIYDFENH
ncbi:MAG TPA: hypothetical protein VK498_02170, partial [Ferruginibacter sp.]|nr:hypothetical protein [Ferruginibacter sp.]